MTTVLALPPERAGYPAPADLAERREQMAAAVATGAFSAERDPVETTLAGLRALRFVPDEPRRGLMLQLHGGGFRIGRPEFECRFAALVAQRCGIEVVVPQYRLAPEHPFPAGFNDAWAALAALREETDGPLIVGGDSAGAGLAASLAVRAAAEQGPRIEGLVLLSPWLDLTVTAPTYRKNAVSDAMFSEESARVAADLYLQGFDARHPLVSPLFAEIGRMPPTLISVGSGEVLADDSLRFDEKLRQARGDSTLVAIAGMDHVAVVRGMELTGAAETFAAVEHFLGRICGKSP